MRLEKKATLVSTLVAGLLVVLKMTVGIFSGSVAVLASAIDSLLDLTVSLFNFFALSNSEKSADEQFNFGRSKIEPLAAVIEGTVISLSAVFILYEALSKIASPREMTYMSSSIWVMAISLVITIALVIFLNYVGKKTGNMVIKADALHYKTDVWTNGAVLMALALISMTGEQLIDPILGIGISIFMIYSAIPIIKEGINMLLDGAMEDEDREKIIEIIKSEKIVTNYHFLQTRVSGSLYFISVHTVFNMEISLYDAHLIADKIEAKIEKAFPDNEVHTIIHMDPYDDSVMNEIESKI